MARWLPVMGLVLVAAAVPLSAQERPAVTPQPLIPAARSFVPLDDLDAVLERDREGVLLPKAEFETLLKAAVENARLHPPAPLATVLGRSTYRVQVVGDQLLITATTTLEQLRPDWQVWSLPLPRLAVEKATINGEPAQIARGEDGTLQVFTSTVGKQELVLELSTELVSLGSDQAAGFALLPSAAGELTMSVPAGKRLMIDGSDLPRPTPIAEPAEYRVAVGGRKQLQLRLTDRVDQQRTDALVFANTGYGLVVAPGEVTWHALTTLQVFGRPLDRVTLSVPSTLEIADVESTGLEAWELADAPDGAPRTILTLTYGQPIDGARRIAVRGVMAVPAGEPWSVPPLTIANVTSHVGQIMIQHPAAVRLQTLETEGVRRATAEAKPVSDMPTDMGPVVAASTLRFDVWREDFTLRLTAAPKQRELHVAVAGVLDLASKQAELQAAFTVTTRFAPLFEFDVDAPAEWSVLSVLSSDNQPLKWQVLPQSPGINRIRIPLTGVLAAGTSTVLTVQWRYSGDGWPVEQEPVEIALPELIIPDAALVETALVVRGDNDLELTATDVVGLDPVPLKAEWERLRLQSQDTRYSARLKISRKPADLAAESVAYYRLDPQTMHAWLQTIVEVHGGGLRSLVVSLPETVGDSVRFSVQGAALAEQQPLEPADGRRSWRLVFGERVFGRFAVMTELERPRDAGAAVAMPVLEIADATRAHGAFVIEAGPEQQLTIAAADAQGQPLLEIDPVDLPRTRYSLKERIVAAYRAIGTGNTVTLTEQRFAKSAVPTAICTGLNVFTVASRTGEMQHQAEFALRLSGVQQLQLVLPETAELWGALLNDQPVEIRRSGAQLLIPLPLDAAGEFATTLKLFYRQTAAALTGAGTLQQQPPSLAVLSGSGTSQTVDILQQSWRLVHPHDTLVVESRTALEPQTALDVPGWLIPSRGEWRWPTVSQVLWGVFALVVTAGVWALVLMMYRGLATNAIRIVAVLALLLPLLFCLMLPAVQQSREAARRTQLRNADKVNGTHYYTDEFMPTAAPAPATPPTAGAPLMPFGATVTNGDLGVERPSDQPRADKELAEGLQRQVRDAFTQAQAEEKPTEFKRELSLEIRQQQEFAEDRAAGPAKPDQPVGRPDVAQAADPLVGGAQLPQRPVRARFAQGQGKDSGLLSLALKLETPPEARQKEFRYVGSAAVGQGVPLEIDYVDRRGGVARRFALLAFGAVVAWGLRRRPIAVKLALVVIGLAISLGLMPIVPVAWQPWLDGVFFAVIGALGTWLVWTVGRGLECVCKWCCPRSVAAGLIAAAMFGLSGNTASAQDKAVPPPVPLRPIPPSLIEVTGSDPLTADQVLLPQAKFVELYRLAHPEKPVRTPSPTPGGLVEALYSGELVPGADGSNALIKFKARFALRSEVDGQLAVAIPIRGVALQSAVLNDTPAALVTSGDPWTVLLPKPGLHVLDLEFSVPAKLTGAAGSFDLTLRPTPAAKLSFRLPDPKLAVRINGSTTVYRRITQNEQALIELPVDRGGELKVSWQPDQTRGGAAVVHVESATAVTATDAGAGLSGGFRFRVRQGVVRDLSFSLPANVKLRTVTGPDVGGWELVGEGADRKLRVFLRRNVGDQTELTIDGVLDAKLEQDAAVAVSGIAPLEITAEVGHVAVYAGPQFSVRAMTAESLMQVDATQYTPAVPVTRLEHAPQLAYRFNRRPWTLDLRISRLATQLRATVQQGVRISHRKTQITAKVVCDLSLVPRSSLELVVSADWLVLDVQSPGLRDWYRTLSNNRAILTLDYEQPRQGSLPVVILASESRTEATSPVTLTAPQVTGASRQQRQLAVWFDSGLSGRASTLGGWRASDPTTIAGELAQLRRVPVQLAFESNVETPGPVELVTEQMQPRLSADSLSVVTVTDVGVVYGLVLQWQIDQAAAETLVFDAPAWLAGRLQFDRSHIRDVTETDSVDGATTRWTIRLRGPVSGRFILPASAVIPPATDRVLAPGLVFSLPDGSRVLETQRHYVLLSNTSLSQLTSEDSALTEPVQREDVDLVVREELVRSATEFVRVKTPGSAPTWTLQRYIPAANIPAAVNLADYVTVVARDGSYRTAATLTLKNRTRQFLAVRLPKDTRLLSVLVGGRPSRAVETPLGDGPVQLIALPKTSAVDLSFPVQVVYAGRLPTGLPLRSDWRRQDLELPTIEVIGQDESPEFGIPVARTQWTVHLPDDLYVEPLTDPKKHNLNRAREADKADSVVQVLFSDAAGLVEALSDVTASKGRLRAYNNLKQLDTALQSYSEVTGSNAQYRQKAEAVRENLSKLEKSLASPQTEWDKTQNGAIVIQSQDARVQFGNAITNNSFVFDDNRNGRLELGDQLDTTFNFTVPDMAQSKSGAQDVKELAKQAEQLGKNSVSFEARQQYQALNEDALSRLNTAIAGKKLADQQQLGIVRGGEQQQGGQQQANQPFGANRGEAAGAMGGRGLARQPMSGGASGMDGIVPMPSVELGTATDFSRQSGAAANRWFDYDADGLRDQDMVLSIDELSAKSGIMAFGVAPGGGGMGGGGFGGGGVGGDGVALGIDGEELATRGWTQAGGLSLLIDVPTAGQKLVFSKAGGDAKLALAVRPQASVSLGLGGLWFVGWLAVAILVLAALRSSERRQRLIQTLPWILGVLAGVAVLIVPSPWQIPAWAVFAVSAGWIAWTHRRPATTAA